MVAKDIEIHKGDKGDIARVLRRLAEAYQRSGDQEASEVSRKTAEMIRQELQGVRFENLPDSEESYDLLVSNFYR